MRKFYLIILLSCVILVVSGGFTEKGIIILDSSATFGAVDISDSSGVVKISGTSSTVKYTLTLTNNQENNITVVSITPVLSDTLASKVLNKNTTISINETIPKGNSINVSGEIILNAKELSKEEINSLEPMVKKIKIIEERTTQNGKRIQEEKTIRYSF